MLNYEEDITQENCQEHHLVDHEMDDVNIASITATAYEQRIDKTMIMPTLITSVTFQVTLIVNLRPPLIKELKYPRRWYQLVASIKVIFPVNCFLIQSLANWRNYKVTFVISWVLRL